jgi:hypothetical protein
MTAEFRYHTFYPKGVPELVTLEILDAVAKLRLILSYIAALGTLSVGNLTPHAQGLKCPRRDGADETSMLAIVGDQDVYVDRIPHITGNSINDATL